MTRLTEKGKELALKKLEILEDIEYLHKVAPTSVTDTTKVFTHGMQLKNKQNELNAITDQLVHVLEFNL